MGEGLPPSADRAYDNFGPTQKKEIISSSNSQNTITENEQKMIGKFLESTTIEETKSKINSLVKGFTGKEQSLINYLNNYDYKNSFDDFMQIAEIKEAAQKQLGDLKDEVEAQQKNNYENNSGYSWTGRIDHREIAEQLPYSTQIQVKKAYYYHEGLGADHTRKITKASYSQNLKDGLQNGETGNIKLSTGKYSWDVSVQYSGESILFTYDRFTQSVLLSERNQGKNIPLNLGTGITKQGIENKKNGTNMSLVVNLDWR